MILVSQSIGEEENTNADHHRRRVRRYYDNSNHAYLRHLGTTLQAALIKSEPVTSPYASNLCLAARAGIQAGYHVLDAGCGVCGPSIDIAQAIEGVSIYAITLSSVQASTARVLVQQAGVADLVRVGVGDYHNLPYRDACFDVVVFFESVSYSDNHQQLFSGVLRVLRPGGILYIKDLFIDEDSLSEQNLQALEEANRAYALQPSTVDETQRAISECGFLSVHSCDLSDVISIERWLNAFVDEEDGHPTLSDFGKLHYRETQDIPAPIKYCEIRARKPGWQTSS